MSRHVNHVVGTAQDEKVTIFVAHRPIKCAVNHFVGHGFPIGVYKTCVIAPHRLQIAGWQWAFDGQYALLVCASELFASLVVDQFDVISVNSFARGSKFTRRFFDTVANCQNWPTCFGLPIVVNDGRAA